jgi:26S proteasome regulatory subunit N3
MSAHSTAVVRHDAVGQETLLNLLLRNYLHYNLYDQVGTASSAHRGFLGGSMQRGLLYILW